MRTDSMLSPSSSESITRVQKAMRRDDLGSEFHPTDPYTDTSLSPAARVQESIRFNEKRAGELSAEIGDFPSKPSKERDFEAEDRVIEELQRVSAQLIQFTQNPEEAEARTRSIFGERNYSTADLSEFSL